MNTELTLDFRTMLAWNDWAKSNKANFSKLKEDVLSVILRNGLEVPLTGIRHPANEIQINKDNLRESIQHSGLNSRRRAALYAIELALENLPQSSRESPRILASESRCGVARVLSFRYPHFLGTDFLPDLGKRNMEFPIRHLDLEKIDLPHNSFDIIYIAETFEYLNDLTEALKGLLAVLRPGGVLISTFRFNSNSELTVNFPDKKNQINSVHHIDGELKNNTILSRETIKRIFGWEFLNELLRVGFEDVKLTYFISSRYGILGGINPGVFVMTASKARMLPSIYRRSIILDNLESNIIIPKRIHGIIGLPRSGTTLLASLFAVHSNINTVYEPWNTVNNEITDSVCAANFYNVFPETFDLNKEILFVKETTTMPRYFNRLRRLLNSHPNNLNASCVFLFRNPAHVYISEVEARKLWWGINEKFTDVEAFELWFIRTIQSIVRMLNFAKETNGILISYEYLTKNPFLAIDSLMSAINIPVDVKQYEYHTHLNIDKVRGDPKLRNNIVQIDPARSVKGQEVMLFINSIISQSRFANDFKELELFVSGITDVGVISAENLKYEFKINLSPFMPI